MRRIGVYMSVAIVAMLAVQSARAADHAGGWTISLDLGGNIPEDPTLEEFEGPRGDNTMKLNAGFQMDMSAGYAITPWLEIGPELGFTFNGVDEIGDWDYPNTSLGQLLMMFNVRLEYPPESRLAPFVGAGVGGSASFLTFGGYNDYYYYYDYADGTAAAFTFAAQAFAGLRYRVGDNWNFGLIYRFQVTDGPRWDVDWWSGADFDLEVGALRTHSFCLLFSGNF